MVADITLTSRPTGRELQVGIRWRSGASEQHTVQRPKTRQEVIRTPTEAIELTRRLAADHTNARIAERITPPGQGRHRRYVRGQARAMDPLAPQDPLPSQLRPRRRAHRHPIAERFGISDGTIYAWIETGKLAARRGPANRLYIPFLPEVEQQCRQLIATSIHLPPKPKLGLQEVQFDATVPAVRDRIVQAAAKLVIEPIFEADMLECSFGFRPRRSQHDALQVLVDKAWRGKRWIVGVGRRQLFGAIVTLPARSCG